jgi:hypothetical protein
MATRTSLPPTVTMPAAKCYCRLHEYDFVESLDQARVRQDARAVTGNAQTIPERSHRKCSLDWIGKDLDNPHCASSGSFFV